MSIGVGLLITMGIILIFLFGIVSGIVITDQNDEEKQKERLRNTRAYKLGQEEAKQEIEKSTQNELKEIKEKLHKIELKGVDSYGRNDTNNTN